MSGAGPKNIELSRGRRFLAGMAIGACAFLVANGLAAEKLSDSHAYDLALTQNIGYAFPALVGLFLGWLQRSLARMMLGVLIGSATGYLYALMCAQAPDILARQLQFPLGCGGLFAMFVGSNRDYWLEGMFHRFLKGGLAGFACGATYFVVLNGMAVFRVPASLGTKMWIAGPVALAAGGGFYVLLMVWAVGLSRKLYPTPSSDAP